MNARQYLKQRTFWDLFVISFLSLFFELACIRWVPGYVREVAYYSNLILLAAFLGLGLGILRGRGSDTLHRVFVSIAILVVSVFLFRFAQVYSPSTETYIWENFSRVNLFSVHVSVTVVVFFLLTTLCFVPIGQRIETAFEAFRPLVAYTINILASIAGIIAFAVVSLFSLPPLVWFAASLGGFLWLTTRKRARYAVLSLGILGMVALTGYTPGVKTIWSPYYKISLVEATDPEASEDADETFFRLLVDDDFHQRAITMDPDRIDTQFFRQFRERYAFPYQLIRPEKVLVLGAGMGNDTSMALRQGVERVDVVEIDPVIFDLGYQHHPDLPYRDPRVRRFTNDARSHLKMSNETYDLIVFGTLDAHRLFARMSSIRLDSFVYTRESLESARRLLAEDGLLVITFVAHRQWIKERFFKTMGEVFGSDPAVYQWPNEWTTLVISNDGRHQVPIATSHPERITLSAAKAISAVDDWPYLYLRGRSIPSDYRGLLVALFLLSAGLIYGASPKPRKLNVHFFALGAGFLLLETKSITEFALLYGATWVVNAVVFAAILSVVLLANWVVFRTRIEHLTWVYALLWASLLFNYFFDLKVLLGVSPYLELGLGSVLIATPLFFAAIIFATTFANTENIAVALGSNLLGAVLGGLLEYVSLIFGLKALYLLSIVIYAVSLWSLRSSRRILVDREVGRVAG
jgi:spermidine synthase